MPAERVCGRHEIMAKRTQKLLFTVLGTVAMVIALLLAPISAGAAGRADAAKIAIVSKPAVAAHSALAMPPCHKPAAKPCPHCGENIFDEAERCPECGEYISIEDMPAASKPLWIVLTAIVCLIFVLLWSCG